MYMYREVPTASGQLLLLQMLKFWPSAKAGWRGKLQVLTNPPKVLDHQSPYTRKKYVVRTNGMFFFTSKVLVNNILLLIPVKKVFISKQNSKKTVAFLIILALNKWKLSQKHSCVENGLFYLAWWGEVQLLYTSYFLGPTINDDTFFLYFLDPFPLSVSHSLNLSGV